MNGPKFFSDWYGEAVLRGHAAERLTRSLERIAGALEKNIVEPDYAKRANKINDLYAFAVRNNDWPSSERVEEFLRTLDKEET